MEIVKEPIELRAEAPKAEAPVATYDPSKKYRWNPNDNFSMNGAEFGILLNALRGVLNTPEAQRILLAQQAADVAEHLLSKAVEAGVAKESN